MGPTERVHPAANATSKTIDLIYLVLNFGILIVFFSKFKVISRTLFAVLKLPYQ
jgi:hypothetical protein